MAAAVEPRGWFAVPSPVRQLFNLFPLSTLPAEALPARSPERMRSRPRLYVFGREGDDDDAALEGLGLPSFNPSCLKWQTFLRIAGVHVDLVLSNNHASPSGALPFLLPPSPPGATRPVLPLTGGKIGRYAREHSTVEIPQETHRAEAYSALLAQSIRPAWLYTLYLLPANQPLLTTLYLPSSPFLRRYPTLHSLHQAATSEILKTTRRAHISPQQLLSDATTALRSLSLLLGDQDEWFFGAETPGFLDAEVFAYTHLMLDETLGWREDSLGRCVAAFANLVEHRKRLYERCWPELQD